MSRRTSLCEYHNTILIDDEECHICEAERPLAQELGNEPIKTGGYTVTKYSRFKNPVWITNEAGEGMETSGDLIPDGFTVEWMDEFWKQNF